MNLLFKSCVLFCLFSSVTNAAAIESSKVDWFPLLLKQSVKEFHVCGNADIFPKAKSINKDFLFGPEGSGFLFSNLLGHNDYFSLLENQNLEQSKKSLLKAFGEARLWRYSKVGGLENLGQPTKIELPYTATVKDCLEGAPRTIGGVCSEERLKVSSSCCKEKFVGPIIYWGDQLQYKLLYSPDPSVRLRVSGEKLHRFCNILELVSIR